jgi:hypothetical protein
MTELFSRTKLLQPHVYLAQQLKTAADPGFMNLSQAIDSELAEVSICQLNQYIRIPFRANKVFGELN